MDDDPDRPSELDSPALSPDAFREALSRWASGVSIVAVRDPDDGRVYATTVSSFASLSAEPPRVAFSIGPGAQVLPFLTVPARFAVNVLAQGQETLATRFADAFPVGPSPFPSLGDPVVTGAHFVLSCRVERVLEVDSHRFIVGRVTGSEIGDSREPLVRYGREYRSLG